MFSIEKVEYEKEGKKVVDHVFSNKDVAAKKLSGFGMKIKAD